MKSYRQMTGAGLIDVMEVSDVDNHGGKKMKGAGLSEMRTPIAAIKNAVFYIKLFS